MKQVKLRLVITMTLGILFGVVLILLSDRGIITVEDIDAMTSGVSDLKSFFYFIGYIIVCVGVLFLALNLALKRVFSKKKWVIVSINLVVLVAVTGSIGWLLFGHSENMRDNLAILYGIVKTIALTIGMIFLFILAVFAVNSIFINKKKLTTQWMLYCLNLAIGEDRTILYGQVYGKIKRINQPNTEENVPCFFGLTHDKFLMVPLTKSLQPQKTVGIPLREIEYCHVKKMAFGEQYEVNIRMGSAVAITLTISESQGNLREQKRNLTQLLQTLTAHEYNIT